LADLGSVGTAKTQVSSLQKFLSTQSTAWLAIVHVMVVVQIPVGVDTIPVTSSQVKVLQVVATGMGLGTFAQAPVASSQADV
jgi:uncharacterized membrane protein YccF (DUF307 family)